MTKETKEKQDYFLMDELPIETQRDIRNACNQNL